MGIRLRPRDPSKHQVGNAIIYGGAQKVYGDPDGSNKELELFYVETDFGNHMKLTWGEIERMWTVAGWQDYEQWRANRDELRSQPTLIQRDKEALMERIFNQMSGET